MRRLINTLILFLLLFLRINTVIGQGVSIRFSLEMENGIDSLAVDKDSLLTVPFLLISYENQSDSSYYLPKVTFTDTQYPCMNTVLLQPNGWPSSLKDHMSEICGHFSDSSFVVSVGQLWDLYVNDSLMKTDDEYGNNVSLDANTEIEDLRFLLTNSDTKSRFNEIDLLPENILAENNNKYFILLKTGEKHVDKINLSLFRFFGGSYKFKLAPNYETTRLYRDVIFVSDPSLRFLPLPLQVGPYYLYQGTIDCNSVFVKFDTHGKIVSVY